MAANPIRSPVHSTAESAVSASLTMCSPPSATARSHESCAHESSAPSRGWGAGAGGLGFGLARVGEYLRPREAGMLKAHDPGHFERVLRERVQHPVQP